MNNSTKNWYRWVSAILGILLIFVTFLWLNARSDLNKITEEFRSDITTYGTELARKCKLTATTTAVQRNECENLLEAFSDTLQEYERSVVLPTTGTSTPISTTTPTSTNPTSSEPVGED